MRRRFQSASGRIYIGEVYNETRNTISMNNYSVWYTDDSEPFTPQYPDDWVIFVVDKELPL